MLAKAQLPGQVVADSEHTVKLFLFSFSFNLCHSRNQLKSFDTSIGPSLRISPEPSLVCSSENLSVDVEAVLVLP